MGCAEQEQSRSRARVSHRVCSSQAVCSVRNPLLGNNRVSSFNPSADLARTRTIATSFSPRLWSSGRAGILPVTTSLSVLLTQSAPSIPGVVRAKQGFRQAEASSACWDCGSATTVCRGSVCRASSGTPALGAQVRVAALLATHPLCSGYAQT